MVSDLNRLVLMAFVGFSVSSASAGNLGHRAGSDVFRDLPENSISILRRSLGGVEGNAPLQLSAKFKYLEFDVQESQDGQLVVFHDKKISRMIPNQEKNSELYKIWKRSGDVIRPYHKLRIRDLTAQQLQQLRLVPNFEEGVPLLSEYLEEMVKGGLVKPVTVEIKRLQSEQARWELISMIADFRDQYMAHTQIILERGFDLFDVTGFIAFEQKFKSTFPDQTKWCLVFQKYGFKGVTQARAHKNNLCD